MERRLWPDDNKCECTCNKPSLMHLPCSHVLACCAKGSIESEYFVSPYYRKKAVQSTWSRELLGWRAMKDFMKLPKNHSFWIPDPNNKVDTMGRCKTWRIRNNMDDRRSTSPQGLPGMWRSTCEGAVQTIFGRHSGVKREG